MTQIYFEMEEDDGDDDDDADRHLEVAFSRACRTEASESLCRRVERKWTLGLQKIIVKRLYMMKNMTMMMMIGGKQPFLST